MILKPFLYALATLAAFVTVSFPAHAADPTSGRLPDGLFDSDPAIRVTAIAQVEAEKLASAKGKLASMARDDSSSEVREAACRALGTLQTQDQLDLLDHLGKYDANAGVRAQAQKAARMIRGEPEPTQDKPILGTALEGEDTGNEVESDDGFKKPTIMNDEIELKTRHIALGFGTMGGYGIAALDVRGRIPTGAPGLPWVGLEAGVGWTPPTGFPIISGYTDDMTDSDTRWKIISPGGAVLLYLHRNHYIPLRSGWNVGQGPFFMLGYGFELLNEEGFFSWGGELGILYHPVVEDWIDNVAKKGTENPNVWPVVPFVRLVLHFYLA